MVRCLDTVSASAVPEPILAYCSKQDLDLATYASVEAQAAALADDIAYNSHDIDDGYRAAFFTVADLAEVPIAARALRRCRRFIPASTATRLLYETNRRLITAMIDDVTDETGRRLDALSPRASTTCARPRMLSSPSPADAGELGLAARLPHRARLPRPAHRPHHERCREGGG